MSALFMYRIVCETFCVNLFHMSKKRESDGAPIAFLGLSIQLLLYMIVLQKQDSNKKRWNIHLLGGRSGT